MKQTILITTIILLLTVSLTGCQNSSGSGADASSTGSDNAASVTGAAAGEEDSVTGDADTAAEDADTVEELPDIYLRLGETDDRPSYEIALEDNEVSVRFVRILQDMTRVLPLYVFDGSKNTDVLQFYDIPSSYDIPDGEPELVTSEKAGEVYYSAGRIMIFYQDAEIEGNYVKIGETLTTDGLEEAVNSNPLDEWGNRRVTIGIVE